MEGIEKISDVLTRAIAVGVVAIVLVAMIPYFYVGDAGDGGDTTIINNYYNYTLDDRFNETEIRISGEFDNGTSNTSGIQEAIDDLPSEGGMVFIPSGIHNISLSIDIDKDNVTLLGAGASSILRTTDSTVINIIEVDTQEYITIEKLAFDGNIGNNPYDGSYIVQCGIYLKECFRVNVINCNFSHMPSSGICSYTTVAPSKGCTIIDCTFKEMDGHAGAAGIEFIDKAEYNKVSECEFVNCKYGIRLGTSNNVVSNCVINEPATSMQSYGIYVGSSYNKIIGCSINHIDGDAAIYIAANDVRIIGCEFLVNQRHGIKINGNRNNNIISECSFFANSFQGLNLYSDIWLGGGAVNGTIISNNIFSGYTGGNKPKYAIDENHASVDYTLISGNIFRNNYGTGMRNIQGANTIVVDNLDMP